MTQRMIFLSLPVQDLGTARAFYEGLGFRINEYSSDPGGLIRWPVRLLIPVAFSLIALQGLSEIIKRIGFLKGLVPASEFEKKEHAS